MKDINKLTKLIKESLSGRVLINTSDKLAPVIAAYHIKNNVKVGE